ncbi:cellulose synthase [Nocardioides daejeonensis]|uniref:cellulose synthase n=1 Tax=Nocardioides daejeonensis TaxID=1046556 RepID=UPI000D746C61|nr:cellulose synthase [Nocardioides daejeonensis]
MNDAAWLALAAALTMVGGAGTWWAFRHRAASAGLKGLALTLLAPAAYLTGTLELLGEVSASVADWASGFVFGLGAWIGLGLAGLAVLLFGVSTRVGDRPAAPEAPAPRAVQRGRSAPVDDDMADIEALLRKRGIT